MNTSLKGLKVVVTGGSGFIPSHLVRRCLDDGAKVAVTVRYGNIVKNERLREVWDEVEVIEADLRNRGALDQVKQWKPNLIFHLAAYNHVGQSFTQVEECFDVNAKGTANLLDTCGPVDKFVYMSTSEVYGHQTTVPFVETMTPDPISPYAITKYSGEMYCRLKQRVAGSFPIVVVRPFNVFGPYQSSKAVIPELIINCLKGVPVRTTKGEQTREFNYVTDIVDGLVRAGLHPEPIEGPINIAAGEEVRICDLVRMIAELTATKSSVEIGALPYRPTEIWRMYADASRAHQILGWKPQVSVREGLRRTVDWFKDYLARHPDNG
ncbi:MAG: GDP-mannose 4,6-dehydratase [Verrucomicrobiales bacterium]|nr:GDP-mannose 4,6-dehydratase [Verrucomicrobiales bacterium]